jgi:putative Ca2+/H+ antiporter (TMEM165/GDT1 family)
MDPKLLITVFATVLLAELGDKTQLSTVLFASGANADRWAVFVGAALALILSSGLAVFAGGFVGSRMDATLLSRIAGVGFIVIGVWTLVRA